MPTRPRRPRRPRNELTLDRDLMLSLGPIPGPNSTRPCPEPGSAEWEALRACFWKANQADPRSERYGPESWGHIAFAVGDEEAALTVNPLIPVVQGQGQPVLAVREAR